MQKHAKRVHTPKSTFSVSNQTHLVGKPFDQKDLSTPLPIFAVHSWSAPKQTMWTPPLSGARRFSRVVIFPFYRQIHT
jgi:hypothetical protein